MCPAPPRPRPEPQVAHILEHPLRPNPSPSPSPAHRTRPETGTRPGTPRTPRSTPGPGRPAARTLIRASGPERGAMRLTGHTSRTIFDRDPLIHEQERLKAEDELVASLARQAQAPRGRAPRTDNPCIGVDDARPDHRDGESHAARFGGAHPASESCDGVSGEGALRWRSFGFVLGGGRVTRIRTAAGHSLSGVASAGEDGARRAVAA